jgi:hypothetical protein
MGEPDVENFNELLRDKLLNDLTFDENDIVRATQIANVALMLLLKMSGSSGWVQGANKVGLTFPLIASLTVLAVSSGMTPARTGPSHNAPHAHPFRRCAEQPTGDQRLTKSVTPSL